MADQLSWYQRVGLRPPEPRPAIGLMQVVSETIRQYTGLSYVDDLLAEMDRESRYDASEVIRRYPAPAPFCTACTSAVCVCGVGR